MYYIIICQSTVLFCPIETSHHFSRSTLLWNKNTTSKKKVGIFQHSLHPPSLTWKLKMLVSNRDLLFQGRIFRFHVKLCGGRFSGMWPINQPVSQKLSGDPPAPRYKLSSSCSARCRSSSAPLLSESAMWKITSFPRATCHRFFGIYFFGGGASSADIAACFCCCLVSSFLPWDFPGELPWWCLFMFLCIEKFQVSNGNKTLAWHSHELYWLLHDLTKNSMAKKLKTANKNRGSDVIPYINSNQGT